MKTSSRSRFVIVLLSGFVLASCSKDSNPQYPQPVPTPPTNSGLIPNSNAVQVTSNQMSAIQNISSNSITFSAIPSGIRSGDIIYSDGYNATAPKGFLRQVTSVSGNTVSTSQAALTDAFENGEIDFTIYPSSLQKASSKEVKVKSVSKTEVTYDLSYLVYDDDGNSSTTNDQVKIEGSISLDGSITGAIKFAPLSASAVFNLTTTLDLNVIATGKLNYSTKKDLFVADGTPVVVSGVVLTPEVKVVFVPTISVQGQASAGINDQITMGLSDSYDGSWHPGSTFKNSFTTQPVAVQINGQLKGELLFEFDVYLYELVGPGINVGPYAELDVNTSQTPWWSLYAGCEGNFTVNTKGIASFIQPPPPIPLFQSQTLVAKSQTSPPTANQPPNAPSNPSPSNYSANVANPVTLSWTCSDSDNDPLTYTLYLQEGMNTPTVVRNLTSTSYYAGNLPSQTQIIWQVVAYDNHGDSTEGPTWSFTTAASSVSSDTLVVQPGPLDGQDTWLEHITWPDGSDTYTAYPNSDTLEVEFDNPSWLAESESLIRFDLSQIPSGSKIISATLELYGYGGDNYINEVPTISLGKLDGPWDEQTVTWQTKPSYTKILDYDLPANYGNPYWHSMDVTVTVQGWMNGEPNYGFALATSQNTFIAYFQSSDNPDASKRPLLKIIYQQ